MKKAQLKATSLRTMMLFVLLMIATLLIGGFYYAQILISDYEISSNHLGSVQNSDENVTPDQTAASSKAAALIVSGQNYQNLIQHDLNKYASDTDVIISEYKKTSSPAVTMSLPLVGGVQSSFLSVTIENPTSYSNLLKFIKAIEANVPKMKLMNLSLTRDGDSGASVNVEPLIIEVYTK